MRLTFNSAAYELAPEHSSSNPVSLHCPALCTYVYVHIYPPTHCFQCLIFPECIQNTFIFSDILNISNP